MSFSIRMSRTKASGIRAVQKKIAQKPGVISFAAGLPDPDLYPLADLKAATDQLIEKNGKKADASKLIMLMGLGIKKGETISVYIEGEDEDTAEVKIKEFFENNL